MSAMAMAIFFRGMTAEETRHLTEAMMNSASIDCGRDQWDAGALKADIIRNRARNRAVIALMGAQ